MVFFSLEPGLFSFQLFGRLHWFLILGTVLVILLIARYREQLRLWKWHDRPIRVGGALLLLANMLVYYGSEIIKGTYDYHIHLPLHFCFISGFLFQYVLWKGDRRLYRSVYFFAFAGPLPAILLPEMACGVDRFIFWQYIISHHVFLILSMYVLLVLKYEVRPLDAGRAFLFANLIFAAVFVFNQVFDTNYIMTDALPPHVLEAMPFLYRFYVPALLLELAALLAAGVGMLPLRLLRERSRPASSQKSLDIQHEM